MERSISTNKGSISLELVLCAALLVIFIYQISKINSLVVQSEYAVIKDDLSAKKELRKCN